MTKEEARKVKARELFRWLRSNGYSLLVEKPKGNVK